MRRIGAQIVEEKKRDAMATMPAASRDVVNASQMGGRDLLSVLGKLNCIFSISGLINPRYATVKANLADNSKPSQKLNDGDVAARAYIIVCKCGSELQHHCQQKYLHSSWLGMTQPRELHPNLNRCC